MFTQRRKLITLSVGTGLGLLSLNLYRKNQYIPDDSLLLSASCQTRKNKSEPEILCAQIFFRHGARTLLSHAPGIEHPRFDKDIWLKKHRKTDIPYIVETFDGKPRPISPIEERYKKVSPFPGGMGAGNLTNLGRDQAHALGERIRTRYMQQNKLIGDVYEQNKIVTRSTNVNRCVESLQSVVAGIYGPNKFKDRLKIKMLPSEEEILHPNPHACPTLKTLEKMFKPFVKSTDEYQILVKYIKYFTGDDTDAYIDLMSYRDEYVARVSHGLPVPLWLEAISKDLQRAAARVIKYYSTGSSDDHYVVSPLTIGPMFHLVLDNFDKIIKGDKSVPALHLFSAHDTSLVPLLVGLGIYDDTWPPYSADVAFELLRGGTRGDEYYVRVLYQQQELILPGFDSALMSLEEFKKHVAPYTASPAQYKERCHNMELARENAEFWEAMRASKDSEEEEYPPNM